ncbi:hypothetical protein [Micromonospora eburnea]|uniref:ABC-2 family transporter protein n=1 Tax=Micromonospora eburnea TaxID=227316 RepID=A0A1C6UZH5_9ACTN|nr:hypothetical protein [Micromonospora eburnea]SCL59436.1 hypothetical protein GA0070604_4052 [Micromonospora eburnea]
MIALIRSELYRVATIRSGWVSIVAFSALGALFGWYDTDAWGLLAGMGALWLAVMVVGQHHQHRTAFLLYLARTNRVLVLISQLVSSIIVAVGVVATSGVLVLAKGEVAQYRNVLTVVPIMAVFGAASAAIVRRATWLLIGYAGWFVFVEGVVGRLAAPLPFSAFLNGGAGDRDGLLVAAAWAAGVLVIAVVAIRRDLGSH